MESTVWIALFGVRGSGKSTLGEYLAQNFAFKVDAFANPLKHIAQQIFDFTYEDLYGPSAKRETQYPEFKNTGYCFACKEQCLYDREAPGSEPWVCMTCGSRYPLFVNPRIALKSLGTEWGRRLCEEIWIYSLFRSNRGNTRLVITDGRFINENETCAANGVHRILLTRGLKDSTDPHLSEAEVRTQAQDPAKYFDFVLDNEGQELEKTKAQLYAIADTLIGGPHDRERDQTKNT